MSDIRGVRTVVHFWTVGHRTRWKNEPVRM